MNGHIKSIHFAGSERKEDIQNLRMREYARAGGFSLDLNTLKWKTSDDESYILVAESEGRLVSTMRGEIIDDLAMLERKLECPWNFQIQLDMPVLLLSRAATDSLIRTSGMNLALRYWFLRFAEHHGIRHVIGTFVSGSPRERSLREMGYQFFENKLGWQQSTYRSHRPVQVVALDMKQNGMQALNYGRSKAMGTLIEYPFTTEFPDLKFVRSI